MIMFIFGCKVEHISVDFNHNTGALHVSEGNMPDMMGTVHAFLAIDEDIKRIEVYVDGVPDTVYLYIPAVNKWQAFLPTEPVFGEIK
jgi:hypothetical protein